MKHMQDAGLIFRGGGGEGKKGGNRKKKRERRKSVNVKKVKDDEDAKKCLCN
jgi:hypothetical protein